MSVLASFAGITLTPSEQLIIGDGKQVWIYDVELEQITHRTSDAAVSQTPAMLLSGKGNLDDSFILEDAGQRDGLDWVRMIPKSKDSGFTDVRIGFFKWQTAAAGDER